MTKPIGAVAEPVPESGAHQVLGHRGAADVAGADVQHPEDVVLKGPPRGRARAPAAARRRGLRRAAPGVVAGEVDDGARHRFGHRAAVEVDGAPRSPSWRSASAASAAGGRPAAVGAADGERTGLTKDLQRHRLQRHPHRDRAARVAEVPGEALRCAHDQRQRPGPERLDHPASERPELVDQAVEGPPRADEDRGRHVATTALRLEQLAHRDRRERVRRDAVDRVGGKHDELTGLQRRDRRLHPGFVLRPTSAVVRSCSPAPPGRHETVPAGEVVVVGDLGPAGRLGTPRARNAPAGRSARPRPDRRA